MMDLFAGHCCAGAGCIPSGFPLPDKLGNRCKSPLGQVGSESGHVDLDELREDEIGFPQRDE